MAADQSHLHQNYGDLSEPSPSLDRFAASSPDAIILYEGELDHNDLSYITDIYDTENVELLSERYELDSMSAQITWYDNHGLTPKGTLEMTVDQNYEMAGIPETWKKLASKTKLTESIFQRREKDRIILDSDAVWEKTIEELQDAQLEIF